MIINTWSIVSLVSFFRSSFALATSPSLVEHLPFEIHKRSHKPCSINAYSLSILVIVVIYLGNMKLLLVYLATRVFPLFICLLHLTFPFHILSWARSHSIVNPLRKLSNATKLWNLVQLAARNICLFRMAMSSIKNESLQNDHDGSDEDANGDNAADGDDTDDDVDRRRWWLRCSQCRQRRARSPWSRLRGALQVPIQVLLRQRHFLLRH